MAAKRISEARELQFPSRLSAALPSQFFSLVANMFASAALVLVSLAASSFATPLVRRTAPGCTAFPINGVGSVAKFTLLAQRDSNHNIQKQLVLGAHPPSLLEDYIGVCCPYPVMNIRTQASGSLIPLYA